MPEVIKVECDRNFDPPIVRVTFAGGVIPPQEINSGLYEVIRVALGWPENPCAGIGA